MPAFILFATSIKDKGKNIDNQYVKFENINESPVTG